MKKYRLKVDSPWGKKGELFSGYVEYFIYEQNPHTGSYRKSSIVLRPESYPKIFEEVIEQSDEEWLAEWLERQQEYAVDCNDMIQTGFGKAAKALIKHGFDVKKLRGES